MEKFIGKHKIETIEMLDDSTCFLSFTAEPVEDSNFLTIVVEYWLDEDTWHFNGQYYEVDGSFIDYEDFNLLSDEEEKECKNLMLGWMKEHKF